MPPSSPPALDDFPSPPSSEWSCADKVDSYLSSPTIVSPDDYMDDKMIRVSPFTPLSHPDADPCFLSEGKGSVLRPRDRARWENMYDPFESPPPRVFALPQDRATDDVPWGPHSAIDLADDPSDASRCSILIHEVSLLVGLAPDDVSPAPDNNHHVPSGSMQGPDVLPLALQATPTKSLATCKRTNIHSTDANVQIYSATTPIFSNCPDTPSSVPRSDKPLSDPATPTPRHKSADGVRPHLSPRRRHGQVFRFDPPPANTCHRNPAALDELFIHPREPPPKPARNPPADRCSSLDRLERSLLKLEAHAPRNHRKSQSDEQSFHVAQRRDKRPSLPPPRRLKKERSSHEIALRNVSRPAIGHHPSDPFLPLPKPRPACQYTTPPVPSVGQDITPGSFMDMDIPCTEGISQRRASFRQLPSKEKMKSLVRAAKTASRGVIAWGKNLAGSTKPLEIVQETTALQSSIV